MPRTITEVIADFQQNPSASLIIDSERLSVADDKNKNSRTLALQIEDSQSLVALTTAIMQNDQIRVLFLKFHKEQKVCLRPLVKYLVTTKKLREVSIDFGLHDTKSYSDFLTAMKVNHSLEKVSIVSPCGNIEKLIDVVRFHSGLTVFYLKKPHFTRAELASIFSAVTINTNLLSVRLQKSNAEFPVFGHFNSVSMTSKFIAENLSLVELELPVFVDSMDPDEVEDITQATRQNNTLLSLVCAMQSPHVRVMPKTYFSDLTEENQHHLLQLLDKKTHSAIEKYQLLKIIIPILDAADDYFQLANFMKKLKKKFYLALAEYYLLTHDLIAYVALEQHPDCIDKKQLHIGMVSWLISHLENDADEDKFVVALKQYLAANGINLKKMVARLCFAYLLEFSADDDIQLYLQLIAMKLLGVTNKNWDSEYKIVARKNLLCALSGTDSDIEASWKKYFLENDALAFNALIENDPNLKKKMVTAFGTSRVVSAEHIFSHRYPDENDIDFATAPQRFIKRIKQFHYPYDAFCAALMDNAFWKQHTSAWENTRKKLANEVCNYAYVAYSTLRPIASVALTTLEFHVSAATLFAHVTPALLLIRAIASCDSYVKLVQNQSFLSLQQWMSRTTSSSATAEEKNTDLSDLMWSQLLLRLETPALQDTSDDELENDSRWRFGNG